MTNVSRETLERLDRYADMLDRWHRMMSLVSASSLEDMWRRHFLDSAQLLSLLSANPSPLVDLGSGAGFPGLVLAIMGVPNVTLIESSRKKCSFLQEVARETDAEVEIFAGRIDQYHAPVLARTITARALAPLDKLLEMARPLLAPGGEYLFLKGARAEDELTIAQEKWYLEVERIRSLSDDQATILKITSLTQRK